MLFANKAEGRDDAVDVFARLIVRNMEKVGRSFCGLPLFESVRVHAMMADRNALARDAGKCDGLLLGEL